MSSLSDRLRSDELSGFLVFSDGEKDLPRCLLRHRCRTADLVLFCELPRSSSFFVPTESNAKGILFFIGNKYGSFICPCDMLVPFLTLFFEHNCSGFFCQIPKSCKYLGISSNTPPCSCSRKCCRPSQFARNRNPTLVIIPHSARKVRVVQLYRHTLTGVYVLHSWRDYALHLSEPY